MNTFEKFNQGQKPKNVKILNNGPWNMIHNDMKLHLKKLLNFVDWIFEIKNVQKISKIILEKPLIENWDNRMKGDF
jgi:hypothetical protein